MTNAPVPPHSPSGELPLARATRRRRWWKLPSSIGTTIILPYALLTAAIAVLGIFIVTRLIANSIEERFTNQILEAARVASDGLVRQESQHLEMLRPMAQTTGLAEAIQAHDSAAVRRLLEVYAYNGNLDSVLVLDSTGVLVLRLDAIRRSNQDVVDAYQFGTGGNYAHLPIVAPILAGYVDGRGDKFAGLVDTPLGPILYTSAPVVADAPDGGPPKTVGVVVVGTTLERLLINLKSEALADLVVYSGSGKPLGSTLPDWQQSAQFDTLLIDDQLYNTAATSSGTTSLRDVRSLTLFQREYRAAYAPMLIRGQTVGVMAVLLPWRFVLSAVSTSRDTFILIFSLGIGLTIVVGWLIARQIVGPIFELANKSNAVAQGDLSQRVHVHTSNELGILSNAFNEMTARLEGRTDELQRENARTHSILDSIADGVIVRDFSGNVLLFNPAAQAMLTGEDSFDPMRLEMFAIPRDQSEIARRVEIGSHTISISMAPVNLPDGTYIGDVLVLRDITHEAVAERTKDSFLNQISHELRTPLTAIQGYADVMRMGAYRLRPEAQEHAMGIIFDASQILAKMIDQIIDLTALQSGSLVLSAERMNLARLVKKTIDEWQMHFDACKLETHITIRPPEIYVLGDARRLSRVLDALFHNVCDFSPDGGPLAIRLEAKKGQAHLSISDPGVGISEKEMPHIFERFFRGNPTDRSGAIIDVRGMGQGLYVVKSIIEAHGGSVQVESAVGKGSTFHLYLPLVPDGKKK